MFFSVVLVVCLFVCSLPAGAPALTLREYDLSDVSIRSVCSLGELPGCDDYDTWSSLVCVACLIPVPLLTGRVRVLYKAG